MLINIPMKFHGNQSTDNSEIPQKKIHPSAITAGKCIKLLPKYDVHMLISNKYFYEFSTKLAH